MLQNWQHEALRLGHLNVVVIGRDGPSDRHLSWGLVNTDNVCGGSIEAHVSEFWALFRCFSDGGQM